MSSATVTSKGQVTIPIDVRTRPGLKPGSRLVFVPLDNGGCEIYPVAGSIKNLKGVVDPPSQPLSIDEMDAAIAEAASAPSR